MDNRQDNSSYLLRASVLYVEDDNDVREQLVRYLRHRVGTLLLAGNGAAGLQAFREHRPQIVVTDIQMPVMDGLNMAREIRQLDPSVPIIVTTAFEQTDYLLRSIEIGVDKYVTKPINVERLSRALSDCARRLRAEELLVRQRALEAQAGRVKHLEAMGVMAGGMAHDFNNLLQVILGYVCLAQVHAEPGSKVRELLNKAETSFASAIDLGQRLRILGKGNDAVAQEIALEKRASGTSPVSRAWEEGRSKARAAPASATAAKMPPARSQPPWAPSARTATTSAWTPMATAETSFLSYRSAA